MENKAIMNEALDETSQCLKKLKFVLDLSKNDRDSDKSEVRVYEDEKVVESMTPAFEDVEDEYDKMLRFCIWIVGTYLRVNHLVEHENVEYDVYIQLH